MAKGFFVTGTDTDIGKTYVSVRLIHRWREAGLRVVAMKPVASGCQVLPDGHWLNDDVERLVAATGQADRALMNPYRFLPPISPHIAAREAGVTISLPLLCQHYQRLAEGNDIVLVEGAGGWLTPLTDQLSIQDLALALDLPIILVVGMRLGCLNHALLTVHAIRSAGLSLAGWVANCVVPSQPAYHANLATLVAHIPAPLLLELPFHG